MKNNVYNSQLAKIAKFKSLLKEYNNKDNERIVYLNDGDEFQIQLFNPYQYVIGVSFAFNDSNVSNKLLVLKPGERIWLDRYLDDSKCLKFSTYEIENTNEAKNAIQNNGVVEIFFYKEITQTSNNWYTYTYKIEDHWHPNTDKFWYSNFSSVISDNNHVNVSATLGAMGDYTSTYANTATASTCYYNSPTIETGRIEKGSFSNQSFDNYYGDFEKGYFRKETIKILPQSMKQISSNELRRKYCVNCGRKLKDKFKFCPFCGEKQ